MYFLHIPMFASVQTEPFRETLWNSNVCEVCMFNMQLFHVAS